MPGQDQGYDYARYRRLLSEAVDTSSRMKLINLLIEERAMDRLAEARAADRAAAVAATVARVLRGSEPDRRS